MNEQDEGALGGGLRRIVPECRIYIRSDRTTRYIALNSLSQAGLVLVCALFLGWSGFATVAYVQSATDARQADIRIETIREAFEAKLSASNTEQARLERSVEEARTRTGEISETLSAKQRYLVDVANSLQEATLELTTLRSEYEKLYKVRAQENERLTELDRELARLRLDLADTKAAHAGMTDAMAVFTNTMEEVIAERDRVSRMSKSLFDEVARLEFEVTRWEGRQERVIGQLEDAARTSMQSLEKIFDRADLDLDRILRETKRDYTGEGGPFEPLSSIEPAGQQKDDVRVAALMTDLERVNMMRVAADRLPFGRPVAGARMTSGFGIRRDPFRRRTSMHSGVDFAGPRGTAILATAGGVVTFAGRQSGYGITIKIRHAFGFETVYAHLNRARVKVGEYVERGDRIADMGSTGRSTGTHLHYEVRINKEPVNPAKFIEAARDVL